MNKRKKQKKEKYCLSGSVVVSQEIKDPKWPNLLPECCMFKVKGGGNIICLKVKLQKFFSLEFRSYSSWSE